LPVKLVVGKSSSRENEEMGKVHVYKLLDLNHGISLEKERKFRKIVGRGKKIETSRS
jgi:hypothetical protein